MFISTVDIRSGLFITRLGHKIAFEKVVYLMCFFEKKITTSPVYFYHVDFLRNLKKN